MEAGQKRRWDNVEASGSGCSGTSQRFSDAALSQAYDAAWMHPSADRQHPLQRAANAAAVLTVQRQQQMVGQAAGAPAQNDLADPLTGLTEPPEVTAPWAASYRRLWNKRLPRSLRVFGWRLLHNSLWVGARKQYFRPRQECVCRQAPCLMQNPAPLQTLSHVLLECPVAQEVWDWFLSVWCRIDPTSIAVASQQLLLLDEVSAEVVAVDLQPLWTHLRLLLLESLWVCRGDLAHNNAAQPAAAIKQRFVAVLKQHVSNDWQRTLQDIRWNAGVPASWFRGRSPELDIVDFDLMWCVHSVIATWGPDAETGVARLEFRLSATA